MKIKLETIPHYKQRYETVGDWFYETMAGEKALVIRVSQMSDPRYELLVAIHELVECVLCEKDGITQEMVDKFDMDYEAVRHPDNVDEPGDDPHAPYAKQHGIATGVERILAAALGVSWKHYADEIEGLGTST